MKSRTRKPTPPPEGRLLLTAEEAAYLLGTSRRQIYALTAAGKLGHVRSGNGGKTRATLRWTREHLQAWIHAHSVDAAS